VFTRQVEKQVEKLHRREHEREASLAGTQ
jgi:hypothetical protein